MNQTAGTAIEGRVLISLDDCGPVVRGTFHTGKTTVDCQSAVSTRDRVGIVLLNSLSLPRAAMGDSAVFWAESLANCGYPSFRLDLPGLGDSGGEPPQELLNFINAGEYASIVAQKVKELIARFGLSSVVLVGHCAGTVTVLFAAARCIQECKGLVLLDPYFHLPQAVRPMVRRGLSQWALRSSLGGMVSKVYDRLRDFRLLLRRNALPPNANGPLLSCWRSVASTGLPILLLKAPTRKATGTKARTGEFDYLNYVLQTAGPASRVLVELIESTDHSFSNCAGRAGVAQSIGRWLNAYAPQMTQEAADVDRTIPKAIDHKSYNHSELHCLQG